MDASSLRLNRIEPPPPSHQAIAPSRRAPIALDLPSLTSPYGPHPLPRLASAVGVAVGQKPPPTPPGRPPVRDATSYNPWSAVRQGHRLVRYPLGTPPGRPSWQPPETQPKLPCGPLGTPPKPPSVHISPSSRTVRDELPSNTQPPDRGSFISAFFRSPCFFSHVLLHI